MPSELGNEAIAESRAHARSIAVYEPLCVVDCFDNDSRVERGFGLLPFAFGHRFFPPNRIDERWPLGQQHRDNVTELFVSCQPRRAVNKIYIDIYVYCSRV